MRFIALDVHSDFCEVAIKDGSGLRGAGRVKSSSRSSSCSREAFARMVRWRWRRLGRRLRSLGY